MQCFAEPGKKKLCEAKLAPPPAVLDTSHNVAANIGQRKTHVPKILDFDSGIVRDPADLYSGIGTIRTYASILLVNTSKASHFVTSTIHLMGVVTEDMHVSYPETVVHRVCETISVGDVHRFKRQPSVHIR